MIIVPLGKLTHMQTGCVQVHVSVLYIRELTGHLCTAGEEQPVSSPHDVGLVHSCD